MIIIMKIETDIRANKAGIFKLYHSIYAIKW